jgi:hypothetical protein
LTAPGEITLPRSADLRGNQASSSPTPPQVALPRWGSSLVVTKLWASSGQVSPKGPPRHKRFLRNLVKQGDSWRIRNLLAFSAAYLFT